MDRSLGMHNLPTTSDQPPGDAPTNVAANPPRDGYVGMFDVAETIARLCNEGTLDLGMDDTLRSVAHSTPQSPEPLPPPAIPQTRELSVRSLDLLSKNFLQTIVNHLADQAGRAVGLMVVSKSGRLVDSAQSGWDAGCIRIQQRLLAKIAREMSLSPVPRYSVDARLPVATSPLPTVGTEFANTESKPTKHACGSVFLNEFAKAIGTPVCAIPIPLKSASGVAIVYCDGSKSKGADCGHSSDPSLLNCDSPWLSSMAQHLDAWLMVQRCDWTMRAIRAVDWIRSQPRWWLGLIAMVCASLLAPVPYYPQRECVFEPESKQFMASPIAGRILSCEVRPGDAVETGQLLARLDDDQLLRDLATAKAEHDGALKKRDAALATRAASNAGLADIEMKQIQWRIESLEDQLRRLEIRAKAPGIVVQGDWHKSVGMPVTLGQSLFEVAELESMIAEVRLKATDLGQISVGNEVSVRSDASGLETFHGKISRIEPRATVIDNTAVFVADVVIRDPNLKLRPGMKATAQISAGWRTLGSLLFERPYHWIANQWIW
jgi:hypothetical protein